MPHPLQRTDSPTAAQSTRSVKSSCAWYPPISSSTHAPESDVPGRGMNFENGAAPVQLAFSVDRLWTVIPAFGGDADIGKIGVNFMSIPQIHRCSNGNVQIG